MKKNELLNDEELTKVVGGIEMELREIVGNTEPRPGLSTQGTKEHDEQILNSEFPSPRIDN